MKFTLTLDRKFQETRVDVTAPQLTAEIEELQNYLASKSLVPLLAYTKGNAVPLDLKQTLRFYTSDKNVYAHTTHGILQIKLRMKELETRLHTSFIRINQGELINELLVTSTSSITKISPCLYNALSIPGLAPFSIVRRASIKGKAGRCPSHPWCMPSSCLPAPYSLALICTGFR